MKRKEKEEESAQVHRAEGNNAPHVAGDCSIAMIQGNPVTRYLKLMPVRDFLSGTGRGRGRGRGGRGREEGEGERRGRDVPSSRKRRAGPKRSRAPHGGWLGFPPLVLSQSRLSSSSIWLSFPPDRSWLNFPLIGLCEK